VRRPARALATVAAAIALAGCLDVQSPDLFLLTRTGEGGKLTLLVNYGGTISCDGRRAKTISDAMLIQARDLADDLVSDASRNLRIARVPGTVEYYTIRMQQGTISFPDRAAATHPTLAAAELFALHAEQVACAPPS